MGEKENHFQNFELSNYYFFCYFFLGEKGYSCLCICIYTYKRRFWFWFWKPIPHTFWFTDVRLPEDCRRAFFLPLVSWFLGLKKALLFFCILISGELGNMIRLWIDALQLIELFLSSFVHLVYAFYIFSTVLAADLSQALAKCFFSLSPKLEVKDDFSTTTIPDPDNLPPIILVHGIFGFGQGVSHPLLRFCSSVSFLPANLSFLYAFLPFPQRLGGLSYFGGAEKKDDKVLVPDLGSLTSIYDR